MPTVEEYQVCPKGWETDSEEERLQLSSMDYLAPCSYFNYALFFKLHDHDKARVVKVLQESLSMTLAQCRQMVGTIEKNEDNDDHSFVKKQDTIVRFVVKEFNTDDDIPPFSDLETAHFATSRLGDVTRLVNEAMMYGEKPECLPSAKPVISAFQANFISGGLILSMNFHHYANDVKGWANFVDQLAENCYSVFHSTTPPVWDAANLDASRFTALDFPSESKVDGPTPPDRHPDLREHVSLLVHLPKSKAVELKRLTMPTDGTWISTYDAFTAVLWRVITRHRASLYDVSPTSAPLLVEAINMRQRTTPPVASRQQRNLFYAAVSATSPNPLTVQEVAASAPLSRLASSVRRVTNTMTPDAFDQALAMIASIRDKTCLYTRVNSFPPLSIAVTDWRVADVCQADFGFGRPVAWRHLFDVVAEGLVIVYPPRETGNEDEGCEFVLTVEKDIVAAILADVDLTAYFEFRGYEVAA